MPSDFEREYKEYIESTTPDFWDKIEAGIADDAAAQTETVAETATTADVSAADKATLDTQSYVNQNKKVIKWGIVAKRIGQFAAVAAIALISFGLVTLLAKGGMKSASPAMTDSTAPAAAAEATTDGFAAADAAAYDSEPMAEAAYEAEEADAVMEAEAPAAAEATADEAPALNAEVNSVQFADSDSKKNLRAETYSDAAKSAAYESAAEAALDENVYNSVTLVEMIEFSPTERVNSASGDQYKFGLTFTADNVEINCLITEVEVKAYAEEGISLTTDGVYNIYVERRGSDEKGLTEYPYVLKVIDKVR